MGNKKLLGGQPEIQDSIRRQGFGFVWLGFVLFKTNENTDQSHCTGCERGKMAGLSHRAPIFPPHELSQWAGGRQETQ